ncbi:MAG: amino acid permease [Candidatus Aminicenantes bacterium]|nr:amino acid permease [Candidatus Aminicenantes bacterium]
MAAARKEGDGEGRGLLRRLGLLDSSLLVVGGVLGSGIFMTTGLIAQSVPSPGPILLVWLAGGLITLFGALTFAELGAMYPGSGGQYIYLREAYGRGAAFFFGWGFFWVIECGGIAALAVGFADYLGAVWPGFEPAAGVLDLNGAGIPAVVTLGQVAGAVSIVIVTGVNYLGIRSGVVFQNIFAVARILAVAGIAVLGLLFGRKAGLTAPVGALGGLSSLDLSAFGAAVLTVLWAYDGWYALNCTAEEVRNPKRNIPLGLILGTLTVTAIYLGLNLVYLAALPMDRIRGTLRIGEAAVLQLFGPGVGWIFGALIALSIFGCLSATIIYGPRVYYAMAKDGLFFKRLAEIHPRYRVPGRALIAQAVWACLLCLSGTFSFLIEYVIFALVLFFAMTGFAVIILRRTRPDAERPYRAWGYPVLPALFVLANLAVFFNTLRTEPRQSLIGVGILAAGLPAYVSWKRKRTPSPV